MEDQLDKVGCAVELRGDSDSPAKFGALLASGTDGVVEARVDLARELAVSKGMVKMKMKMR